MNPIAVLLARIGWLPAELAARLGVAPDTVGQWMRDRRSPPTQVLARLEVLADAVDGAWSLPPGWAGARPGRRARDDAA